VGLGYHDQGSNFPFFQVAITFSMSCHSIIVGLGITRYIVSLLSISTFFLLFEETSPGKTPCTHNRHEPRSACTANSAFSAGWISGPVDPTAAHYPTLEVGYLHLFPSAPLDALRVPPMCLSPAPGPLGMWSYASVRQPSHLISNFPSTLPTSALHCTFPFLTLCHDLCRYSFCAFLL
jgi:hypothetical protein